MLIKHDCAFRYSAAQHCRRFESFQKILLQSLSDIGSTGKLQFDRLRLTVDCLDIQISEAEYQCRKELSQIKGLMTVQENELSRRTEEVDLLRAQLAECKSELQSANAEIKELLRASDETNSMTIEADAVRSKLRQLALLVTDLEAERNALREENAALQFKMQV